LVVTHEPETNTSALQILLLNIKPHILVVRNTEVNAEMLGLDDNLGLIVRAGSGTDTIDLKTCRQRGIQVSNCPGANAAAVAELAFGLILALDRRIPENLTDLRRGRWNKAEYVHASGLKGRTLGLVGLGHVGREMVVRAQAFGMTVIAWSRSLTKEKARNLEVIRAESLLDLAERSDIVSLHVALSEETIGLIDGAFLGAMQRHAFFINTARAEIVDESALLHALDSGSIRAGLDVFRGEPRVGVDNFSSRLFQSTAAIGTHHIGGATEQAENSIASATVEIIMRYVETGIAPNQVK
jgi:D-3-phosphoglycerate dehydrogenase